MTIDSKLRNRIREAVERGVSQEAFRTSLENLSWDEHSISNALVEFELIKLVSDSRKRGVSDRTIRNRLKSSGWSDKEISLALNKIYFSTVNHKLLIKPVLIILVLIGIFFLFSSYLLPFFSSIGKTSHHINLDTIEFNESLYNSNILSYKNNLSKNCPSGKISITGMIVGGSLDFSDVNVRTNIGSLNINSLNSVGEFNLENSCSGNFILTFEKKGFIPLHKKIVGEEDVGGLIISLKKDKKSENFNAGEDYSISEGSVTLEVSKNSFSNVGENVQISLSSFNSDSEDYIYFPGENKGLDINGNVVNLESFGFFKLKALGGENKGVELSEGKNILGSFSLSESQKKNAPKKVALWNYDEKLGIWKYIGDSEKVCEGKNCFYKFNLASVGSWFSLGQAGAQNSFITINGFDSYSKNKRNEFSVAISSPPIKTKPTIKLEHGQIIEKLDSVKTNMICEYDHETRETRIEGYDRMEGPKLYEDRGPGLISDYSVFERTTEIDYVGKGTVSIIKDSSGGIVREVEVDCTCKESKTYTNKYLIGCAPDYWKDGKYYDGCLRKKVSFFCEEVQSEGCKNPKLNSEFESIISAFNSLDDEGLYGFLKDNFGLDYNEHLFNYLRGLSAKEFAFGVLITSSAQNHLDSGYWRSISSRWPWISASPRKILTGGGTSGKCNLFVYDVYSESGVSLPKVQRENGKSYAYTTTLYKTKKELPGLRKLDPNEFPLPGDIVTDGKHVMIVSGFGEVVGTAGSNNERITKLDGTRFGPNSKNYLDVINSESYKRLEQKNSDEAEKLAIQSYSLNFYYTYWRVDPDSSKNLEEEVCLNEDNLKQESLKITKQLEEFNKWLQTTQPAKINVNPTSGNFILNLNKLEDISFYEGVDLISGKIHYPINDFVYYSEISDFKNKLNGNLVAYDSFIAEDNGRYYIGGEEGLFKLIENNSLVQKDGNFLKVQNEDSVFEFKEKDENIYFITKKRIVLAGNAVETNYFYDGGNLKKVESEGGGYNF